MPWIDAFAPAEARYREQVLESTWGHLAPEKNHKYPGRIVFAVGIYDSDDLNPTIIVCNFEGLHDSPWLYEALQDFVQGKKYDPGCVYEWTGHFRNHKFVGKVRKIEDYNHAPAN